MLIFDIIQHLFLIFFGFSQFSAFLISVRYFIKKAFHDGTSFLFC